MKKSILSLLTWIALLNSALTVAQQKQDLPYWQDNQVVQVNKEYPRTSFMTFDSKQNAINKRFEESKYYQSLNGTWKFFFVDSYKQLPENIVSPDMPLTNWKDIKVPGNWEMQGFGTAIYTNHGYEFQPRNPQPPLLPEMNPVGVYRREIEVPSDWKDRNIFLHIAGAKSGVYVYINGKEVGYSEDSKNPAEFLINDYLTSGKNTLVLKIFRWSTGSYLECQDFWRISGIERDVYLWSQPKTSIRDFAIVSTLDDSYTDGIFNVKAMVKNHKPTASNVTVSYELLDAKGKVVAQADKQVSLPKGEEQEIWFDQKQIANPLKWTAETPNLYKVVLTLKENGTTTEIIPHTVGFRRIEIRDHKGQDGRLQQLFLVNGQPIKLKGVNIHETNPKTGHYMTEDLIRKDFELMKQHNLNTVRLAHYTQSRRFYELCDEYGLYVYDEANIESHGMYYDLSKGRSLGNNPEWLKTHMDRIINMYERNKNHPSVTIWSLGNEAGNGYNFYQAYLWLKEADKNIMQRPVNYERALWEWNTDMYVPQYPSAAWLEEIGKRGSDRPIVPSEYSHAMGNSSGNLALMWKSIYKYDNLQGGYIWDWVDQGMDAYDEQGRHYWTYGGDYGKDMPSDGNFLCNGLINPDRTPHPAMTEVKYAHQNFAFETVDAKSGRFSVTNRFYFTNSSNYAFSYSVLKNGQVVKKGNINVSLNPQEKKDIQLNLGRNFSDGEYFILFEVHQKQAKDLVPAGHLVASEQFQLSEQGQKKAYKSGNGPALSIQENGNTMSVNSSRVQFVFDKASGVVTSYKVNGTEYFNNQFGIQPNFWRGPNDNDYGSGGPHRLQVWKQSSKNFNVIEAKATKVGNNVEVKTTYLLAAGNPYTIVYTIHPSGVVKVDVEFTSTAMSESRAEATEAEKLATFSPEAANARKASAELMVPRIGVRFRLPQQMNSVEYYGRGPGENYTDRNSGSHVAIFKTTAEQMYFPYVRPQENGHRTDTRWVALSNNGKGLLVVADSTIGFNSLRNSVEDFDSEEATNRPYQWNNFDLGKAADKSIELKRKGWDSPENRMPRQTHINDITPRDFVEVCIDMKQQGVAGYNSWGDRPLPEHSIPANRDYKWGFTLVPVQSSKDIRNHANLAY